MGICELSRPKTLFRVTLAEVAIITQIISRHFRREPLNDPCFDWKRSSFGGFKLWNGGPKEVSGRHFPLPIHACTFSRHLNIKRTIVYNLLIWRWLYCREWPSLTVLWDIQIRTWSFQSQKNRNGSGYSLQKGHYLYSYPIGSMYYTYIN